MESLYFDHALLPDGWASGVRLRIERGRIARVESGVERDGGDAPHGVAIPGLCNLHSHAFQRAMAGMAERSGPQGAGEDSFWTWREAMYGLALELDPDDFEAIARDAFSAMLRAGFTRVAEFHYLHNAPDGSAYPRRSELAARLVSAAEAAGISLTLLPVLYRWSGFGEQAPTARQRRFVLDRDDYALVREEACSLATPDNGLVVGLAAHSLRAVGAEDLEWLAALDPDVPIHIHIAEQRQEVADCIAATGKRPVAWLADNAALSQRWCLVHATHVEDRELEAIAKSGAVAGLCPITEANLGDGIFPAARFAGLGGRWGVGSDSNVEISAAGELRLLEYGQRLQGEARNVLAGGAGRWTARTLYANAVAGGARACGVESGIETGNWADIVTLTAGVEAQHQEPDAILSKWVFSDGVRVANVWARGVLRVEHSVSLT